MKLIDLSPYSSFPPRSGGQTRIFNLNLRTAKKHDVFQFSFMPTIYNTFNKKNLIKFFFLKIIHSNNPYALQIPLKSQRIKITKKYVEYTFSNPFFIFKDYCTSKYRRIFIPSTLDLSSFNIVKNKIIESDLVQVEASWLFDWVNKIIPKNKQKILVMHNIYSTHNNIKHDLLKELKRREKNAISESNKIFVVSENDKKILLSMYEINKNKIHIIPNGVDASKFKIPSEKEKNETKKRFGLLDKKIILFTGSRHRPNIEAVNEIYNIASKSTNSDIIFIIAGSIGDWVIKPKTDNIIFTGYVNEIYPYFKMADIAINPMLSGGGTNLKLLEYLSSGIPVISTKVGVRGLKMKNNKHLLISNIENFPDKIEELLYNESKYMMLKENGRNIIENRYDWEIIANKALNIYDNMLK